MMSTPKQSQSPPSTQRRQARLHANRAARRDHMIEAAKRVLARDGASAVTIRAVAAEAGYTPGAVYSYFKNKDELALELIEDELATWLLNTKNAASHETQSAREKLILSGVKLVNALAQKGATMQFAPVLFRGLLGPAGGRTGKRAAGRVMTILSQFAENFATHRHIKNPQEIQRRAAAYGALVIGAYILSEIGQLEGEGLSVQTLLEHYIDLTGMDA